MKEIQTIPAGLTQTTDNYLNIIEQIEKSGREYFDYLLRRQVPVQPIIMQELGLKIRQC